MLAAVGLPILFLGGSESIVVDSPPAASVITTVPPATVPPIIAAEATTPAEPMTWSRISDTAAFGGDGGVRVMTDVATGSGVAVAVGFDGVGGDFDAAVWFSVDGVAWSRVPHDEAVFGGDGHQQMNAVVAVESGFIAVGSEGGESDPLRPSSRPSESFETQGVVWRSDDGVSWERVPHDDALSEGDTGLVMNDVVFNGSRLVAVGGAFHRTAPFATYRWGVWEPGVPASPRDVDIDVDAAAWISDDGVTWRRVGAGDEAFGGDTIRQSMNAVVAGGPGFVAVGQEGFDFLGFDEWTPIEGVNTDGREHVADNVAAVWTSPDGETWTRVEHGPSLEHGGDARASGWATIFDVTKNGSGLVAVGRVVSVETYASGDVGEGAAVWLSPDGLSWQRVAPEGAFASPDMQAIATTDDGRLVAGGGLPLYIEARLWSSQDNGNTWAMHPGDDENLFGGQPTNRAEDEAFGRASIRAISAYGGKVLAVGQFNGDAAVWAGTWAGGGD
jgi:hypothetical protein